VSALAETTVYRVGQLFFIGCFGFFGYKNRSRFGSRFFKTAVLVQFSVNHPNITVAHMALVQNLLYETLAVFFLSG